MFNEQYMERLKKDAEIVDSIGFNPYYKEIQSALDDRVMINKELYINLASNNYLGLASDSRVKKAIIKAVEKFGASLCGTPIATGYSELYKLTEEKLSQFLGLEDTIIFPSCYQANNGIFRSIASKDDLIIVDRCAHSSLIEGIMSVGCKIRPFLHNNMEHLEDILKVSRKYNRILVVTESVFSTEGSTANFREIVTLCEKYGAIPVVDDSHGIGVLGKRGRGILEVNKMTNFKGIYTASLGKALANSGGIISGEKSVINYLRYYCPHLIYSTALSPMVLAGINAVISIIESEFCDISEKVNTYKSIIYNSLISVGFEVVTSTAPINSIKTGSKENTLRVSKKLFEKNILTTPFIEPSVPSNEGRVRLIAGANLKLETVKEVAKRIISGGDI